MIRQVTTGLCLLFLMLGSALLVSADTPLTLDSSLFSSPHSTSYSPLAATPCVDGMAGIYPCDNVDLLAFVPFADMGAGAAGARSADIWGWTDSQNGDEYALLNLTTGTVFFRISDPENPVFLGYLDTHTVDSNWRDVKVYQDHAFIVSEATGHGMQVFDLTQLRTVTTPQTFTNTAHYGDFGNAHNIVINEDSGFAYAVGTATCAGGLHMIDISTPTAPTAAGCFDTDGYTHDAQCVIYSGPDTAYTGREICFNFNEDTVTIADVTDKSAPVLVSRTPGFVGCISRSTCYTHQGWLTPDQKHLLVDDELDEQTQGIPTTTYIFDVSDLDAPALVAEYAPGIPSIDHNLYVRDQSAFLSNYTSGLRILSLQTPTSPRETGFFDVYPANDNPVFTGTWSNYPFFDSGVVIVSSIDRGLFILKPRAFALMPQQTNLISCNTQSLTTSIDVLPTFDFGSAVSLTATGVPTNATATFSPNAVLPGQTTTLTITSAGQDVNFEMDVVGTAGSDNSAETLNIILGAPSSAPIPVSPASMSADNIATTTFTWQAAAGTTAYLLEVSDTADFSNIIQTASTTALSYEMTNLPEEVTLYWRVTANNSCGSVVSAETKFLVVPAVESCQITYQEDFENQDGGGWTLMNTSGYTNSWATTTSTAQSGTTAWFAPDTSNQVQGLATIPLTLAGDRVTLSFWQQRSLTPDSEVGLLAIDGALVDDALATQILDAPYNSDSVWSTSGVPLRGWSGLTGWQQTSIDLTNYIGQDTVVDFVLLSDGNVGSSANSGWAIDNVQLETCTNVASNYPLGNIPGFEPNNQTEFYLPIVFH